MTTIHDHDLAPCPACHGSGSNLLAKLPPLPIAALMIGAFNLLQEAARLPQPRYISVSEAGQHIELQFPDQGTSLRAIAQWVHHFGGVIASKPHDGDLGPRTYCTGTFDYYGLSVKAYAFIPVPAGT